MLRKLTHPSLSWENFIKNFIRNGCQCSYFAFCLGQPNEKTNSGLKKYYFHIFSDGNISFINFPSKEMWSKKSLKREMSSTAKHNQNPLMADAKPPTIIILIFVKRVLQFPKYIYASFMKCWNKSNHFYYTLTNAVNCSKEIICFESTSGHVWWHTWTSL